jgi:hypothetical protein
MRKTIRTHTIKCDFCVRRKQHGEYKAPLGTLAEASALFVVSAMEFVGSYPLSHSRNRYLMSFIDQFIKYAELIPVPDQTAATCAKVFVTRIIARYGTPKFVVSDSGSQF